MSFDFESDDGEHMMSFTYGTYGLSYATLHDQMFSRALSVYFCPAFKVWVSVLRDPFCEVSIDISIGGLCDSNKV